MKARRVALFADSFYEMNGVARTCREFVNFTRRHGLPMLAFVPGSRGSANPAQRRADEGIVELASSGCAFALDSDLLFDPLFMRHGRRVREAVEKFQPDVVHITGPGHLGLLGALTAHRLRLPLAASWHTNIHQYAKCRLKRLIHWAPTRLAETAGAYAEHSALTLKMRFYRIAAVTFAPNMELVRLLQRYTGKPSFLMPRGIDLDQFSPRYRDRGDAIFRIGYVGRLSPEKNLRLLADIENIVRKSGVEDYQFVVVGQGSERDWLFQHLQRAEFTGPLSGEALSRAYASFDAFVFPSATDTYGNAVQEALASGVPALVTGSGGPRYLVRDGVNGFCCNGAAEFAAALLLLYRDRAFLGRLREGAVDSVRDRSWDKVFANLYACYDLCQAPPARALACAAHAMK